MSEPPFTTRRTALTESTYTIDIDALKRNGALVAGQNTSSIVRWGIPAQGYAEVKIKVLLKASGQAELVIEYMVLEDAEAPAHITQRLRLDVTHPPFGGQRWWINCPVQGNRVRKVYMLDPRSGFASRTALNLRYRSQYIAKNMRPFHQLLQLQRRLGTNGWLSEEIDRPKGMWFRTFDRLFAQHAFLRAKCEAAVNAFEGRRRKAPVLLNSPPVSF